VAIAKVTSAKAMAYKQMACGWRRGALKLGIGNQLSTANIDNRLAANIK